MMDLQAARRPWLIYTRFMNFAIEFDRNDEGRWMAEIPDLPGVMA